MSLSYWFTGRGVSTWESPYGSVWPWVTIILSALVALGYCSIAINWYFQRKFDRLEESKAALKRLVGICVGGAICGLTFHLTDAPWLVWCAYDLVLIVFVVRTWAFVVRMRGLGLIDDNLKQLGELEREATKYREIAELLPHMVWTAMPNGRVDFSNQRWREYAGGERTWLQAVHPDDATTVQALWNEAVMSREPFAVEARLNGIEGYRTFVIKATLIVQGEAARWLGACADIEDQKQLAMEKDRQAKQKSFFLNALSHDLRAPLHNVLLNAHLLEMSAHDEAEVDSIQMIKENAVAAGDLVTRLLDFAKVGAQDKNAVERISVDGALNQIVRRFQPIAEQKSLYVRLSETSHSDVWLLTDRQKLERIVSNLVDNAIKYTKSGGVTIEVAKSTRGNTELSIRVRDSGIGIPKDHIPYLFDEFYQVDNYERDRSKGFGMGLAICRCLAGQIGGELRLASTGSEGSCFELVLKRNQQCVDRGGRQVRPESDHADTEEERVCRFGSQHGGRGD